MEPPAPVTKTLFPRINSVIDWVSNFISSRPSKSTYDTSRIILSVTLSSMISDKSGTVLYGFPALLHFSTMVLISRPDAEGAVMRNSSKSNGIL